MIITRQNAANELHSLKRSFQKILRNNFSGSEDITMMIANLLIKNVHLGENLLPIISNAKKEIGTFHNTKIFLSRTEKLLKKNNLKELSEFLKNYCLEKNKVFQRLYERLYPYIKNKSNFITISNSKTVREVLKLFNYDKKNLTVTVCESRPVNEGKNFAKSLVKYNIKVNYITEAQISKFVPQNDAAIIGADTILSNGNVVNKIGSSSLAIICKQYKKPFYVLADKSKFSSSKKFNNPVKPSGEIWKQKNKLIKIQNYYFEEIEKRYITKIV